MVGYTYADLVKHKSHLNGLDLQLVETILQSLEVLKGGPGDIVCPKNKEKVYTPL